MRKTLAAAVLLAALAVPARGLLVNGDFENGDPPRNWHPSPGTLLSAERDIVRGGQQSLRVEVSQSYKGFARQLVRGIDDSFRYTLSGWVYFEEEWGAFAAMAKVIWHSSEDGTGEPLGYNTTATSGSGAWVFRELKDLVPPPGAKSAWVKPRLNHDGRGAACFDDFSFRVSYAPPVIEHNPARSEREIRLSEIRIDFTVHSMKELDYARIFYRSPGGHEQASECLAYPENGTYVFSEVIVIV